MGDEIKYLFTKNGKFPFVYSLNVMEQLQNRYGTLKAWADKIEPKEGKEPSIKDLLFFFKEAINEGIDIENENNHESKPFINEKQAGRIISEIGLAEATKQLKEIVVDSTNQDSSSEETKDDTQNDNGEEIKNLKTTQILL